MSDLLRLRPYQERCIANTGRDLVRGLSRVANVLPTGAGKTVVFAHMIKLWREAFHSTVVVLVHTDELVSQAARKLKQVAPHLRVGIVKAERNDVWADVIVASVQSLRSPARLAQVKGVGLIVVDECHHATAKSYRTIMEHYGCFDGRCKAVGFTATLVRGDRASLGEVWETVSFRIDILSMIRMGHLLDPHGIAIEIPDLDLDRVRRKAGGKEFQDEALSRALIGSMAPELVAKAYAEHASDRSGVLFWPTVESARVGAEAMRESGIGCEVVHGGTPRDERRDILARLESGALQTVSNCMVLTEGFDAPRLSCAVIARPTRSAGLYQQMVGRILRPFEGQTDALVLDVVGAGRRFDLASLIDLSDKVTKVEDGQGLLDAADDDEEESDHRDGSEGEGYGDEVEPYRGPVVAREFDPLAKASARVWLTTDAGWSALAVGAEHYVFLLPGTLPEAGPADFDVLWCTQAGGGGGGFTEHRGLSLSYAMQWAEQLVDDAVSSGFATEDYGRKGASWRRGTPTEKQVAFARRLGVDIPEGCDSGTLSALIDAKKASNRIDPVARAILGQGSGT